jgi:ADP-heptose:LPS heptosyltransferase
MNVTTPRSVLYIRPDSIGDLVIFSSALAQLLAAWPAARHTLLVRPGYDALAPLFPAELRWQVMPVDPFRQHPGEAREALAAQFGALERLAPDLIVAPALNRTWLEVAVAAHFPGARRVALGRRKVEPNFRHSVQLEFGVDPGAAFAEIVPADERKFDWDNNHRIVDHLLGRPTPRAQPSLAVPASAKARAREILTERNLPVGNFVAVFVGGSANVPIKVWPAPKFAELALWLRQARGLPVLLLGEEPEAPIAGEIGEALRLRREPCPPSWFGHPGEVALLAGLLACARCYVGPDTGAMHLAAALGRPVVGIFGGGHWPRFRPVGRRVVSVVQPLPCFGCSWDCLFADAPCVKTIPVAEVAGAVDWVLEGGAQAFDRVREVRGLPADTVAMIGAVTQRYAALREARFEQHHIIERMCREAALKDMEIAVLQRELETKDRKIVALSSGAGPGDGKPGSRGDAGPRGPG